ncbi:glycosyl hydrolase 53 family protein [bacterium]|nr:glycosyl hydrolase 53 family protein [bacterium]
MNAPIHIMRRFILAGPLVTLALLWASAPADAQDEFMVGGDVSSLRAVLDNGGVFYDSGEVGDPLDILQEHGFNWVRQKIWHTPDEPYNDLPRVTQTAVEAVAQGYKFLLDFHYSDTWADPGTQEKPAAWEDLEFDVLVDSVYEYTYAVMTHLRDAGVMPDMVQIGNEINCGMLWPDGNVCGGNNDPEHWNNLATLINAGISAVHDSEGPDDDVKIMIHHSHGFTGFLDNLLQLSVEIDVYGRSYYPTWHGDLSVLQDNLTDLATNYDQDIVVAEVAYMFTTGWNDNVPNVFWEDDVLPGYPATPAGQNALLSEVNTIIRTLPGDKGVGAFYWEPAWISTQSLGTPWENACLFDFDGESLPAMDALAFDPGDLEISTVTMTFNTSTVWDTLNPTHVLQLRGEVRGFTGSTLPDGRNVSWDDDSELFATNTGGDYWRIEIPMVVGDTLSFKCWTGFDIDTPTSLRLGWEGPIVPAIDPDGNTRLVVAEAEDYEDELQFLNGAGSSVGQYWRPYETDPDSVVIQYRANVYQLMQDGMFDPDDDDMIGVIGSDPLPQGDPFLLTREEFSVGGGSFWTGHVSVPRTMLQDEFTQTYRFAVVNNDQLTLTEDQARSITLAANFAASDTTLHWVYFNENFAGVDDEPVAQARTPTLFSAYPNPFNGQVTLEFSLASPGAAQLVVYNTMGQRVWFSADNHYPSGAHRVTWSGFDSAGESLASGVYIVSLNAGGQTQSRKIVLLR